jgi:NAD(P)-dependent dehydrogenase (short-subunit alcohol dehydrogenase family)
MNTLENKIALITGATAGIGKETALALAKQKAHLLLPVRNMEKGRALQAEIAQKTGHRLVNLLECDLASLASVARMAAEVQSKYQRLDILINNAGVWESERKLSQDKIELTWAVNHLAPFLLTNLLLPMLKQSAPARIINVASDLHQGEIQFDDPEFKKRYELRGLPAYRQSKLANILFTRALAKRLEGSGVTANCLMPGFIASDLFRDMNFLMRGLISLVAKSPRQGAATTVYLATSEEVAQVSGEYFKDKKRASSSHQSKNMQSAERLWELSIEYVKNFM